MDEEEGIREAAKGGILIGYEMVDFIVHLVDGSFHEVDSSEMSFKIAGSLAFKEAARLADPTILEPMMDVEVVVPPDYLGDVINTVTSRRGGIREMRDVGGNKAVDCDIPLAPSRARTLEAGKRWARLAQARAASRPGLCAIAPGAELELRRSGSSLGPSQ